MLADKGKIESRTRRRGVILVVILGMLGLLALIGVTFASFSGQSRISAINFSQAQKFPDSAELMDFALSQLIDDTANPSSVIRGHSLKRDMYGYDAIHSGVLAGLPDGSGTPITITSVTDGSGTTAGLLKCQSNFPTGSFYSYNYPNNYFNRWIIRFPGTLDPNDNTKWRVGQTHEIILDDNTDSSGFRIFYIPADNNTAPSITGYQSNDNTSVVSSHLLQANTTAFPTGVPFQLDGRYQRAFNGSGMSGSAQDNSGNLHPLNDGTGHSLAEYANFRYNGNVISSALNSNYSPNFTPGISPYYLDPNLYSDSTNNLYIPIGMDEDYDAPDLENWFLAIQSADGKVVIPSFHRPGILTAADWSNTYDSTLNANDPLVLQATRSMSRILRPRASDGHSRASFPPLLPGPGGVTYDVDNDGDSVNDSVWLDLGYPPQTNPEGQVFKPMFSFMVIGLNGKLPLNTAGNLQSVTTNGIPTFNQSANLGFSPSEIDISFALQNGYDPLAPNPYQYNTAGTDYPSIYLAASPYMQVDDAGYNRSNPASTDQTKAIDVRTTQLRNLLAGTRLPDPTYKPNDQTTIASQNYDINAVMVNGNPVLMPNGVIDDNDPYATDASTGNVTLNANTPTVAGRWGEEWGVPAFLTRPGTITPPDKIDYHYQNQVRAGFSFLNYNNFDVRDDNHNAFDYWPPISASNHPENADYYDVTGSLIFPVERIRRFVTPTDIAGTGRIRTYGAEAAPSNGGDPMGRVAFFGFVRPPGLLIDTTPTGTYTPDELATWDQANTKPHAPSSTNPPNNRLHGYEGYRNPFVTASLGGGAPKGLFVGGMPSDGGAGGLTVGATTTPTFDLAINSNPAYPSRALNEADEMKLFEASQYDRAFGPSDLQWLYRFQDVDGQSLQSRLATLAPISFLNPLDGPRRRRMFALDAFDPTTFAWSNNSMAKLQANGATNAFTPPIAHRDRRVNLNFPLPVSNSPLEPVRQKWIRESYSLLKLTLPPTAVDTPEELAQLSQYLVNLIDFRDPDATSTQFTNTDITVTPATATASPKIALATGGTPGNLVQHGMEYSPIAINEVLAYQFETKVQDKQPSAVSPVSKRMFFEVVNTLTQDATSVGGLTGISNDLDLTGWDVVVMPDNGFGRPDPITGQIPTGGTITPFPLAGGSVASPTSFVRAQNIPALPTGTITTAALLPRGSDNKDYYFVFGNNQISGTPLTVGNDVVTKMIPPAQPGGSGGQTVETGWPNATVNGTSTPNIVPNTINLDLTSQLTTPNTYYWLYLRRPANPFDTANVDPDGRVVVDSFRFMYTYSQGRGSYDQSTMMDKVTPTGLATSDYIYSLQRMQPYRGGHAITPLAGDVTGAVPTNYVVSAYGYSEQTFPAGGVGTGANVFGQYGALQVTGKIRNTLGQPNKNDSVTNDTVWEYFPFNDRDFSNVTEMTLVPAVAPGLFTKQFVENAPPINFSATPIYPSTISAATAPPANTPVQFTSTSAPRTFPYLSDKFFYSGEIEPAGGYPMPATGPKPISANGKYIGGPSGAGWHSMLEFFEVPSPAFGATGTVASGSNYDWARQDLKPGLLNINLIIDEEVFLGLMGSHFYAVMNKTAPAGATNPKVVLQVDNNGSPTVTTPFCLPSPGSNQGSTGFIDPSLTPMNHIKGAFADFLNLRHGGSGYLYGYGHGTTGSTAPLAAERPYRSLTYRDALGNYDINATVMRPATLPPSANTTPVASPAPTAAVTTQPTPYVADPGVKNPYLYANNNPVQPPPIPTRRLFQIPDGYGAPNTGTIPPPTPALVPSNASPKGDPNINTLITLNTLTNPDADMGSEPAAPDSGATTNPPNIYLGGLSRVASGGLPAVNDNRDHPYFRSEWLQRVANLTTVRTHQYAVWITVGFFEVTQQGDPSLALTNPFLAYDTIGLELGVVDGKNTRYRSFFLLDRTRATGFNPANPGDFRDVVVYRQSIED